jgi:hypothetical protein
MNLAMRLAGLFATFVFLLTAMPGFFKQVQPHDIAQMANDTFSGISLMETLMLSVGGAVAAGVIGYIMGDILTHPDTRRSKKKVIVQKHVKEFTPNALLGALESPPVSAALYEPPPQVPTEPPPLQPPPASPSSSEQAAAPASPPNAEGA